MQDEENELRKHNLPNKFLDHELNYMKEIRETYFKISPEDICQDESSLIKKINKHEISEHTLNQSFEQSSNKTMKGDGQSNLSTSLFSPYDPGYSSNVKSNVKSDILYSLMYTL